MNNTLIISDPHFPYQHPDFFEFLAALEWAYSIEIVKCTGDIIDNHTGSFHDTEYGTLSPKEEHEAAYNCVQKLYKMFPKMTIVQGNHDAIPKRKAKAAGIPEDFIKDFNQLYDVDWKFVDRDFFRINKYDECLLVHTMGANTLSNARNHSHCSVQGHHHGRYGIEYFGDTNMLRWSMTLGCLVDQKHPAFNYASGATLNRPIIGCGGIIDDEPRLFKMRLLSNGRWDGKI